MPTPKATEQKGGIPRVRKLFAVVPEDIYKALKHYAVEHDVEMREVITESLRRYLGVKEGGEKKK
jgi:hypothetical protein